MSILMKKSLSVRVMGKQNPSLLLYIELVAREDFLLIAK